MKVTYNWLKEMVDLEAGPEELAERLTMAGAEVESVEKIEAGLPGVLVGKVVARERDAGRPRIHWCRVSAGTTEHTVACGAPNVVVGMKSALALPGTVLPGGRKIEPRKIGGRVSEGMLCSEQELGLGDDAAGIVDLPAAARSGDPVAAALALPDYVIEVNVTPNRPDLLSVRGVAREAAVVFNTAFNPPASEPFREGGPIGNEAAVEVKDFTRCPNYTARLIREVKVAPSPFTIRRRLALCGIRPINNIVDATNYVLLETGQPLHAFDFRLLRGGKIIVRRARKGEKIVTIDGVERVLSPEVLVIADQSRPVAAAGIMGGIETEVSDATREVLLESAFFNPVTVRRSARELGLFTEASRRFERTVDPAAVPESLHRAAGIIAGLSAGIPAAGWIDEKKRRFRPVTIRVNCRRLSEFLGMEVEPDRCRKLLSPLGVEFSGGRGASLSFRAPSWRPDLTREADLAEEIARLHGYQNFAPSTPRVKISPRPLPRRHRRDARFREIAAASGLDEAVNYSFMNRWDLEGLGLEAGDPLLRLVEIANPPNRENGWLRTTLLTGLLRAVHHNLNQSADRMDIFELGRVYLSAGDASPPDEESRLALALCPGREPEGWRPSPQPDFFSLKGLLEEFFSRLGVSGAEFRPARHPLFKAGRTAEIIVDGRRRGWAGEASEAARTKFDISRPVFIAEIAVDGLADPDRSPTAYRPLPQYPAVGRDIAVIVDESTPYARVARAIEKLKPPLVEDWALFDIYRGRPLEAGKKSLAFKLRYRSESATLVDKKVTEIHEAFKEALAAELGCRFRE